MFRQKTNRFYKDDSHNSYWGEDKYSGGRGGSTKNFPGFESRPPLTIPAGRFVVHFHSDGSNTDWGYKITVTPKVEPIDVPPLLLESSHPYVDNMNTYDIIAVPGAVGYSVTFDEASCTEASCDYVR